MLRHILIYVISFVITLAIFSCQVSNGSLKMYAKAATWPNSSFPPGFGNFTTSAIHSINRTHLGMFEVRSKSGTSAISSRC